MTGDGRRIVVLYTLAGAAVGVLLNVLAFAYPGGKTDIVRGMGLTLFGTLGGFTAGAVLAYRAAERPPAVGRAVASGVVSLAMLAGAAVGWVVADLNYHQPGEEPILLGRHEELTHRGAVTGAGIGAGIGLLTLTPRWLRRTAPSRPGPGEPPAGDHTP